jgi:psp operon transcriptional activator
MALKRPYESSRFPVTIPPTTKEALGQSSSFLAFQEQLSRAAGVDRPVLLVGERGTGKELAAARLHYLSKRWKGPFVTLNCAALAPSLIESELFGYEKGAFTGADQLRKGRFEAADGGSLFLDEVSSIPLQVQEKILRVVEYGDFERVGSSRSMEVDVRIIGASNKDLFSMAREGEFKEDLLDRLCFEVLFLPPLREREGDIQVLTNHFAARMAMELGWEEVPQFTDQAIRSMAEYPWPGNVRELKNTVERTVYRSDSPVIEDIEFHPFQRSLARGEGDGRSRGTRALPGGNFQEAVEDFKVSLLSDALKTSRFNQRKAAATLGLTYHQFRGLLRKYRKSIERALGEFSGEA